MTHRTQGSQEFGASFLCSNVNDSVAFVLSFRFLQVSTKKSFTDSAASLCDGWVSNNVSVLSFFGAKLVSDLTIFQTVSFLL